MSDLGKELVATNGRSKLMDYLTGERDPVPPLPPPVAKDGDPLDDDLAKAESECAI